MLGLSHVLKSCSVSIIKQLLERCHVIYLSFSCCLFKVCKPALEIPSFWHSILLRTLHILCLNDMRNKSNFCCFCGKDNWLDHPVSCPTALCLEDCGQQTLLRCPGNDQWASGLQVATRKQRIKGRVYHNLSFNGLFCAFHSFLEGSYTWNNSILYI